MSGTDKGGGRRPRKRGNGEATISKRSDGRYAAAIYVDRPDGTRGRKRDVRWNLVSSRDRSSGS